MSPFDIIPSSFFNKPWHRFVNSSGMEIPAYACMRITDTTEIDNDIVFQCAQPNSTVQPFYLINGPVAIANDSSAEGRATTVAQAGYVLVSGTPAFGDILGPSSGSWAISSSGQGFMALGAKQSTPDRVVAVQLTRGGDVVQVYSGGTAGDLVEANADGLHAGVVKRWINSGTTFTTEEDCWIRMIDFDEVDDGATISVEGRYFVAVPAGSIESASTTKPLYLCQAGEQTFKGKPDGDIAKGSSGTVSLYNRDETDSGINKTAKALGMEVFEDKWVTAARFYDGAWYVGCWET